MADWFDSLPQLEAAELPAMYADVSTEVRTANGLPHRPRSTTVKTPRRTAIDAKMAKNAAAALQRLPEPGESLHMILSGLFDLCTLLPRVLKLADCRCERLTVATLGFNARFLDTVANLHDAGQLEAVHMLASCYFRTQDASLWDRAAGYFGGKGWPIAAGRTHAKLQLYEFADGRRVVLESSANLRSCRMAEVVTLFADGDLLEFHRGWIREMFEVCKIADAEIGERP